MIQFTQKERDRLRGKAADFAGALGRVREQVKEVYEGAVLVPDKGIGNWSMYYFCPHCSLPLRFSREKSREHTCQKCGGTYRGEPYDSSWWGKINSLNAEAAYQMGLLYLLTGDAGYGRKAAEIMLAYAEYYPGYETHGDIPYNGPGKANAQTLDEAVFLRNFAFAFDLVQDCMSPDEQETVKRRMFLCGGQFLMEHRNRQVHNHEVITNAALGVLGILLDCGEMIQKGVYGDYGLLYQLEHGMQEDCLWFEGTFGYHYYALENFFSYEKFAVHTPHSNMGHPNYRKMMEAVLDYIEEDGSFPLLNDINAGHGKLEEKEIYEFAYPYFPSDRMAMILNLITSRRGRDNLEALLYGVPRLPDTAPVFRNFYSDKGSGYTVLRGPEQRYLIFKHGSYGGEHDHYDRLGISYSSHGVQAVPDIGTTGYGAVLHYDYYKNTGAHNTVCIGEANQPPVQARATRYEEKEGIVYVEAEADWREPYRMPDSFTIVQWEEEPYKNVSMKRKIAWAQDYFADLFIVRGAGAHTIDWTVHIAGERLNAGQEEKGPEQLSCKKPLKYLHDISYQSAPCAVRSDYRLRSDGVELSLWSCAEQGTFYHAKGPDNPSVRDMEYLIWRVCADQAVFLNVFQTKKRGDRTVPITGVSCERENGRLKAVIHKENGAETIWFDNIFS